MLAKVQLCNIVIFENYLFSFRIISQSRSSHNFTTCSTTQFLRNVFTQFSQKFSVFFICSALPFSQTHTGYITMRMRQVKVLLSCNCCCCPVAIAVGKLMKIFSRNSTIYRQILGHNQKVDGPMKIKDRQPKGNGNRKLLTNRNRTNTCTKR